MFFGGFRQISAYFGHWVYFGLSSNRFLLTGICSTADGVSFDVFLSLKVGSCPNHDKSVQYFFLSFSV